MLSDELEALAADTIKLFGVSLVAGAYVRKLKRLAKEARQLEQHLKVGSITILPADRQNVESLDHARRQKQLTKLAERGKK